MACLALSGGQHSRALPVTCSSRDVARPEPVKAAGLDDVRLHDFRHSHASVGAAAGLSLPAFRAAASVPLTDPPVARPVARL